MNNKNVPSAPMLIVYSHERELVSAIHALGITGMLGNGPHVALYLSKRPVSLRRGERVIGGVKFHMWDLFLTFDTTIDHTTWRSAERFGKTLRHEFPDISLTVLGDVSGPKAVLGMSLRHCGHKLILVPEGLGIYRHKFGSLPWRQLSGMSAIGNRLAAMKQIERVSLSEGASGNQARLRFFGHLLRVIADNTFSRHIQRPEAVLNEVDLALSNWPERVPMPVRVGVQTWITEHLARDPSIPTRQGHAIFLHSPAAVSSAVWVEILRPLVPMVSHILLRSHRAATGLDELKIALDVLGFTLEMDSRDGPLETHTPTWLPEYFLGVTSTSLLDVVYRYPELAVISVARSLKAVLASQGDSTADFLLSHQLVALEKYSEGRITFV